MTKKKNNKEYNLSKLLSDSIRLWKTDPEFRDEMAQHVKIAAKGWIMKINRTGQLKKVVDDLCNHCEGLARRWERIESISFLMKVLTGKDLLTLMKWN